MRLLVASLAIFAGVAALAPLSASAQKYRLTPLGFLPGGASSLALDINENGQVVGVSQTSGGGEGYIWDSVSGMIGIGVLDVGDLDSDALAINDLGQVVGRSGPTGGSESDKAFLWDPIGGMSALGFLPDASKSRAVDVSNSTQVVGTSGIQADVEAFLWDPVNGMEGLGFLGEPPGSRAEGINDQGQVVGASRAGNSSQSCFIWDPVNGMVSIGDLPGGPHSCVARAINDLGEVVGTGKVASGLDNAFIWDPVNGIRSLGSLPGGVDQSLGIEINNAGQVIGSSVSDNGEEAFVWDSLNGMRALTDLVDGSGAGWFLYRADAINEMGQIVGGGINPAGQIEAYLLTPIDSLQFAGSLTVETIGNDQDAGTLLPTGLPSFVARPLGSRCNPLNGGGTCGTVTLQQGAPLTGSATLTPSTFSSPPAFILPSATLGVSATGSLPAFIPYIYVATYASNAENETGSFFPGGGPGTYSATLPGGTAGGGRLSVTPGSNQFGGTMRLLGVIGARRAHEYKNHTFVATGSTPFSILGGSCSGTGCPAPGRSTATTAFYYKTAMGKATTAAITAWGFPWTTGTVSISAPAGPFPTLFARSGYDNRTPLGVGTIQLVTPHLAHWTFPNRSSAWQRDTGAIGVLRVTFFVPEPSQWFTLVLGMGVLWALYRRRSI